MYVLVLMKLLFLRIQITQSRRYAFPLWETLALKYYCKRIYIYIVLHCDTFCWMVNYNLSASAYTSQLNINTCLLVTTYIFLNWSSLRLIVILHLWIGSDTCVHSLVVVRNTFASSSSSTVCVDVFSIITTPGWNPFFKYYKQFGPYACRNCSL